MFFTPQRSDLTSEYSDVRSEAFMAAKVDQIISGYQLLSVG
jgi:hypothetical protein